MKISSVRELKRELTVPLTDAGGILPREAPPVGVPAGRTSELGRIHPGIALGVAPGGRPGDYRLAVRVQHRDLMSGGHIEAIAGAAHGEVDVQYIGQVTTRQYDARRERPVRPGASIGHFRITAGTLGAIVRVAGDERPRLLSNNHVLADENRGAPGDEILQPGAVDGGVPSRDRVATLERFVTLDADEANAVDAALALLDSDVDFEAEIADVGRIAGVVPPEEADRVVKRGRTTGLTRGSVTAIEVDALAVRFSTGVLRFDGQIEIAGGDGASFSSGGDSGSLIADPDARAGVGLLFAGGDQGGPQGTGVTYANPLGEVLEHLAIAELW